ncbi:hypothetical protein D3C86_1283630 [compost metagenome]
MLGAGLTVQFIGPGEVAHQHDLRHVAAGQQPLIGRLIILRMQPHPVHARIELEPDGDWLAQCSLFNRFKLPQRMHHAPEIVLDDQRQLIGFKKTFQQQHRRTNACGTQLQGFFDASHGKTVCLGFQCLGTTHRAMAVGIGLDHREGFGPRDFTGDLVVVTQGLKVDQGTGRTHGGRLLVGRLEEKPALADGVNRQQRRKRDLYYGLRQRGDDGNFDQDAWLGHLRFDGGAGRRGALWQPLVPNRVHPGKVRFDIIKVNRCREQMLLVSPGQIEQTLDIGQYIAGLLFNPGVEVVTDLPGQIHRAVMGDDLTHAFIGELALD